jgi:two-component system LytT family response regulator
MIRAVVIDDEPKGRQTLINLLNSYCKNIEVVAEAANVSEGKKVITDHTPDVVFLDIQLTDGTGFDILTDLKDLKSKVIFTTAYDQYAIKAFRFSALDYLLKPIDPELLIAAVEKITLDQPDQEQLNKIKLLSENREKLEKIALYTNQGVVYVKVKDIIRCEADSNYTTFYLNNTSKIVVTKSLKEFDETLSGLNFFRIHKSHLINLSYIKEFDANQCIVKLEDGTQIEVARRRKESFLSMIKPTSKV